MKYLKVSLLLLISSGLIIGCATPATRRDAIPDNPPQVTRIETIGEKRELTPKEEDTIRRKTVIINFDVKEDPQLGRFVIDVHHFESMGIKAGESIIWECGGNIPFTVHFGWDSPFEKGIYPAKPIGKGVYRTEVARTRESYPLAAKAIEFKYIIAAAIPVKDNETGKLKMEVIVYDPFMFFLPPGYSYN